MVLPWIIGAYGLYKGFQIYNEGRALNDYLKRYPWVKVKYPSRTKLYKSVGSAFGVAGMYHLGNTYRSGPRYSSSYDPVKYMYR